MSHEDKVVLRVNTSFIPNVNPVTRNYYFFHLFCPYVKHFKKRKKKKPAWANHISGILMMSGVLQKSTENAVPNSENVPFSQFISTYLMYKKKKQKTTPIAHTLPIRHLDQCISEDLKNEIVFVLKRSLLIYSGLWQFLCHEGSFAASRERWGTVFAPSLSFKTSQHNLYLPQSLDGGLAYATYSVKKKRWFFFSRSNP